MGWLYLAIVLFAFYMIVELLGVTGLVICLLVALAYGVVAMAIKGIWRAWFYFDGVFRALKCFAIAFVLLMATWSPYRPPYLFYAAYFALLIFLSFRLKKERKQAEEAMQKPLQTLMAIAEDFAHFLPGHNRALCVSKHAERIGIQLYFFSDIETERFNYNHHRNGRYFSEGYQPSAYDYFCYALLDDSLDEDSSSKILLYDGKANILPYLSKPLKAKYPAQFRKIGGDDIFWLGFV